MNRLNRPGNEIEARPSARNEEKSSWAGKGRGKKERGKRKKSGINATSTRSSEIRQDRDTHTPAFTRYHNVKADRAEAIIKVP